MYTLTALTSTSFISATICSFLAVLGLIVVLLLCTCGENAKKNSDKSENIEAQEVNERDNTGDKQTTLKDANELLHKNGSLKIDPDRKGSDSKGRALPDIPSAVRARAAQDTIPYADEEDVNYDIINKENKIKSRQTTPDYDPYTNVEGSGDGAYTQVKDSKKERKRDPPYSHVKGEKRENVYAKVDGEESAQSSAGAVVASPSGHDLDGTYASVAPPVPEKRFDEDYHDRPTSASHDGREETADVNVSSSGPRVDPSYTSVTARESLASIRQREAAQDEFYEVVTEEDTAVTNSQVEKGPPLPTSQRSPLAKDKLNISGTKTGGITSEFYAEISTADGDMYATVSDGSAPPPPSVARLKTIRTSETQEDDDEESAGYTCVRVTQGKSQRPHSATEVTQHTDNLSAMYAQVEKGPRRSKTLHSERDFANSNAPAPHLYALVNKVEPCVIKDRTEGQRSKADDEFDPGYYTVKESDEPVEDADPGYATVTETNKPAQSSSVCNSDMVQVTSVKDVKYKRKEHLYQEIDDAKVQKNNVHNDETTNL